jgi:predicted amidohydrolase
LEDADPVSFRIAVVQFQVVPYQPELNLARAEERLREAAGAGAELVVFPEDFVTGVGARMTELADADGTYRATFRRLAKTYGVELVPGSCLERDHDGRIFNATYYIDRSGNVLGRYCKVHLWMTEKPYATPGDGPLVWETRFGRVGLAICWDLAFPGLFRGMFRRGVDIVVCPACWSLEDAGTGQRHDPHAEHRLIDACCTARAFENEIITVFCNVAGEWESRGRTFHSAGHSQVALPFVGPAAMLEHNREAILLHDVDTAILDEAERSYRIKEDLLSGGPDGP